jgi:hypothetical protein
LTRPSTSFVTRKRKQDVGARDKRGHDDGVTADTTMGRRGHDGEEH